SQQEEQAAQNATSFFCVARRAGMSAPESRKKLFFWRRLRSPRTQPSLFHYIKEEPEPSFWSEVDFSALRHPIRFLKEEWNPARTQASLFHYISDTREAQPVRWKDIILDLFFREPPPDFIPTLLSNPAEVAVDPAQLRAARRRSMLISLLAH